MPRYSNTEMNDLNVKIELDNIQKKEITDLTGYLNYYNNTDNLTLNADIGYGKNFDDSSNFSEFSGTLDYYFKDSLYFTGIQDLNNDGNDYWETNVGRYLDEGKKSYLELSYSKSPLVSELFDKKNNDWYINLIYGRFFVLSNGMIANLEMGPQLDQDDDIKLRFYLNIKNDKLLEEKLVGSIDLQFFIDLKNDTRDSIEDLYTTVQGKYQVKSFN
jgi:hypothetical protein